jgi:hypothetical protein
VPRRLSLCSSSDRTEMSPTQKHTTAAADFPATAGADRRLSGRNENARRAHHAIHSQSSTRIQSKNMATCRGSRHRVRMGKDEKAKADRGWTEGLGSTKARRQAARRKAQARLARRHSDPSRSHARRRVGLVTLDVSSRSLRADSVVWRDATARARTPRQISLITALLEGPREGGHGLRRLGDRLKRSTYYERRLEERRTPSKTTKGARTSAPRDGWGWSWGWGWGWGWGGRGLIAIVTLLGHPAGLRTAAGPREGKNMSPM